MKTRLIAVLFAPLLVTALTTLSTASAGQVIYENMYSGYNLIQGEGKTVDQAKKDALSALPKGWKIDDENSPVIECTRTGGVLANGTKCDDQVAGNQLRVTIPMIQTSI
jgi:hypothetical protein